MEERWLPVPGYEGRYSVSDQGRIRSEARLAGYRQSDGAPIRVREQLMTPVPMPSGHLRVRLRKDGGGRNFLIHRLVLEAFVGPCPEGMECCHGLGGPADNRLENLRWGTRSENQRDAVNAGQHASSKKVECKRGHRFDEENTFVDCHGARQCRKCSRWRDQKYKAKRKAKA